MTVQCTRYMDSQKVSAMKTALLCINCSKNGFVFGEEVPILCGPDGMA